MPKVTRAKKAKPNAEEWSYLQKMRHSASHVLAMAVLKLRPGAKLAIGPAIADGFYYDFDLSNPLGEEDLPKLESLMKEIITKDYKFEHLHLPQKDAEQSEKDQPYKLELLADIKDDPVSFYKSGDFIDLCIGPHVESTGKIGPFKLLSIAGAYWKGSEKNRQLTRVYGTAFETQKELDDFLKQRKEAEKRDHRKIGKELELFTIDDMVGPGLAIWLPKGTVIKEEIEKLAEETERVWGYERVSTPHIAKEELFTRSGHLPYYKDSMFPPMELDDGKYYLKAMNCPIHHLIYQSKSRSYRELPLRLAEWGTVYRYELSGTLAGLLRVRGMTMNDAHIYVRPDQVKDEFLAVMRLHEYYYKLFGIRDYYMRLSLHDPANKGKYIDNPQAWNDSEDAIRDALKVSKIPYVEAIGEAAFYGPKVDFQIKSVTGREESASTNQLDFSAAERFDLTYTDKDNKEKRPYVIHRAPLGTDERFIAILIEHYAGAFPTWLSPVQVVITPIADRHVKYAHSVIEELSSRNVRVELDERNESIGKKIRDAELQRVPYILVVGDKEEKEKKVAVRQRGKGDRGAIALKKFTEDLVEEIRSRK